MKLYHGTYYKIDYIDLNRCHFGLHFGNICQAIDKIELKYDGTRYDWDKGFLYVYEINEDELNIHCLEISDIFLYDDEFIFNLKRTIIASLNVKYKNIDKSHIRNIENCLYEEEIRNILINDFSIYYLKYKNKYETDGISYCIINENILKNIKEYKLKDYLISNIQ